MAIVSLALSPRYASLMLEQGSYASSETRLDFGVSLDSSKQIADLDGSALDYWSLRIRDASSSVCADDGQHGAGSIRYRPPPPNNSEMSSGCMVEAVLSTPAFASLLAICIAGKLPERFSLEVDGLDDSVDDRLTWDRNRLSSLTVISLSLTVDFPSP